MTYWHQCTYMTYSEEYRRERMMQICEHHLSHLENLKLIFVEKFKDQKILMDIAMHTGLSNKPYTLYIDDIRGILRLLLLEFLLCL